MKRILFCVVGVVAFGCYGGLFDSALKAVNKAAEVANEVDTVKKTVTEKPQEAALQVVSPQTSAVNAALEKKETATSASALKWDAAGYEAKVAQVKKAMPDVSQKLPLQGDPNTWYGAAYELTTIDKQYGFMPLEQRISRVNAKMRGNVDKFLAWVEGGMQDVPDAEAVALEAAHAKKEQERAQFAEDEKRMMKLNTIYLDCESLIEDIYGSNSSGQGRGRQRGSNAVTSDKRNEKDAKLAELKAYFNDWEPGVGPAKKSQTGEKEYISEEKANEYKSNLQTLKKDRIAAANQAIENEIKIGTIQQECENLIGNSKLSFEGKEKRKTALRQYFTGNQGGRGMAITIDQANAYKATLEKGLNDIAALDASTDESSLRKAIDDNELDDQFMRQVSKQLVSITKDPALLLAYYDGDKKNKISPDDRGAVATRLVEFADKITDTNIIVSLLKASEIKSPAQREKLLSRLPDDDAFEAVMKSLSWHGVDAWNKNNLTPFDDAIIVMKRLKGQNAVKLVGCVLSKFLKYESECRGSLVMSWAPEDAAKVKKITEGFPKFDDATLEEILCADGVGWQYFINSASADVAYDVLVNGKAQSEDLESELAKKLPAERIDMKAYNGAKFASSKKLLCERMPLEMKKAAAKAEEDAFKEICKRAKAASKETFELDGFYLGMSFDDAKIVLSKNFPALQIKEDIDGKGKDADHVIYIAGQKSPFCFARTSDKKVWLFNFGKKLLKKWYDFDKQTYMEWAVAYENKMKIDMRFELVEKKTTVFEDDMSESYTVWFHQEAYQHRDGKKKYLLTYFGEEREWTIEGGIGGDLIKERAAPDFRYVRGDPGSLRVRVAHGE